MMQTKKETLKIISFYLIPVLFTFLISMLVSDYSNMGIALLMFLFLFSCFGLLIITFKRMIKVYVQPVHYASLCEEIVIKTLRAIAIFLQMYLVFYFVIYILKNFSHGASIYGLFATFDRYSILATLKSISMFLCLFIFQLCLIAGFCTTLSKVMKRRYSKVFQLFCIFSLELLMLILQFLLFPSFVSYQQLGFNIFQLVSFMQEFNVYLNTLWLYTIGVTIVLFVSCMGGAYYIQKHQSTR